MSLTKATNRMLSGAVVNALDYGLSETATAAANKISFEAALDAGLTVYIPPGEYPMDGPVYVNKTGRRVYGASMGGTKITFTAGSVGLVLGNSASTTLTNHDIVLSDIWLAGGTYPLQTGNSISPLTFLGEVSRVKLTNGTAGGLFLYQAIASFNDLAINNNFRGIVSLASGGGTSSASMFNRCRIYENTNEGWYCEQAWGHEFNECNFESNGKEGVKFAKVDGTVITNVALNSCWFESNLTDGTVGVGNITAVAGSTSHAGPIHITNCEFNGVTGSNIHVYGSFDVVNFTNNRFISPSSACINLTLAACSGISTGNFESFVDSANLQVLGGQGFISPLTTVDTTAKFFNASAADGAVYGGFFINASEAGIGFKRINVGADVDRSALLFGVPGVLNGRFWMDDSGIFRWKSSDPTSATDGTIVGTQTFSGTHVYKAGDLDLELGESVKLVDRKIYRTTTPNDPACIGIYAGVSGMLRSSFNEALSENNFGHHVISLGDTIMDHNNIQTLGVLVDCPVEVGDLLATSSVSGKLTKQSDNIIYNYTIAKVMEAGDSSAPVYAYILS